MNLEARQENCFSSTHVLKLDGRPCGKFTGRIFSEGIDVELTGRRKWRFERTSWLSSEFVLKDADTEDVVARAASAGIFTSKWKLELSIGEAELVHAGWFQTAYQVEQEGNVHARVDRLGVCQRGWIADNLGSLNETDLLLAGLVYQVIRQRQERQAAAAHGT